LSKVETKKHIFSADRPINCATDDRLNRAIFSKELALSIANWSEKDSLIVAIYGAWGEGKSSVKNMVKEIFEKSKKPLFMEFNPWQWANEEKITDAFFRELSNKLGNSADKKQRLAAKKMTEYAEYLDLGNELVGKFKTVFEKTLVIALGGTSLGSVFTTGNIRLTLEILTLIFVSATLALDQIIWGIRWIAKWRGVGADRNRNLEDRKADLIKTLAAMNSTLVVFIDDVDRLTKSEIKSLFRVLKANADFPNIVYLTIFQRDIVEKSLGEGEVYNGKDYLKKIVQVGFDVPKVPASDIHNILFEELNRLLSESALLEKFEKNRWNSLFVDGLSGYFKNLRDVRRFISTFSFHLGILKKGSGYEINFIDLIGIEVLRQFEPQVYETMFRAKKLLTSSASMGRSHTSTADKKQMNDILTLADQNNIESVKSILKELFPNSEWAWGSNYIHSVGDQESRNLRINHEDHFDKYFSLFLPDEEIPQSDFEFALSITGNAEEFYNFLIRFHEQKRLPQFIRRFEAYKQVVDKKNIVPFISTLLSIGDVIPRDKDNEGFFSISPMMHLKRIIHWYLKKSDFTVQEKQQGYWKCLEDSNAVFLPIDLLWEEYERQNERQHNDYFIFSENDSGKIKNLLIQKIEVNKTKLHFSTHLTRILFIWIHIEKEKAMEWLKNYLTDDSNFIKFLKELEGKGTSSNGYETKVYYYFDLKWLSEFFEDFEELFKRADSLRPKIEDTDDITIRVFESLKKAEERYRNPDKKSDPYDRF